MSGLTVSLLPGRQRVLAVEATLADLDAELEQLRQALPLTNDAALHPALDQLGIFARTADSVLQTHGHAIDQRLIDALADLLGTMRVEVNLARLSLTLGETTIDFAAMARATGAMADLTSTPRRKWRLR
jgi:hypothetical protein